MLGLAGLLAAEAGKARADAADNPLAVKPPMFEAKAKRIIFLFPPLAVRRTLIYLTPSLPSL